jgi:hypothetical protein
MKEGREQCAFETPPAVFLEEVAEKPRWVHRINLHAIDDSCDSSYGTASSEIHDAKSLESADMWFDGEDISLQPGDKNHRVLDRRGGPANILHPWMIHSVAPTKTSRGVYQTPTMTHHSHIPAVDTDLMVVDDHDISNKMLSFDDFTSHHGSPDYEEIEPHFYDPFEEPRPIKANPLWSGSSRQGSRTNNDTSKNLIEVALAETIRLPLVSGIDFASADASTTQQRPAADKGSNDTIEEDFPEPSNPTDFPLFDGLRQRMHKSIESQQVLQLWDLHHGLPRSHSPAIVKTSRSRRQLQMGKILAKWDGSPLINNGESELGKPRKRRKRNSSSSQPPPCLRRTYNKSSTTK